MTVAIIEVLGNHRRQSQQSRLELGLPLRRGLQRRTIFVADAHRDDEKLTAFLELESQLSIANESRSRI
jgi:hypothetical protein